ncbi:hypothetical protein QUB10_08850 [Microcoleus sp. B5-D4]|uniref:hypothetical protein n=1 Tax=unclassified Microcoleus TaxID=2642155 RepID=UPI002FD76716
MGTNQADKIYGKAGNYILSGFGGNDDLWGGTGNDDFHFKIGRNFVSITKQ